MNVFRLHEMIASLRGVLYWLDVCDCLRSEGRGAQHFTEDMYERMLADVEKANDVCNEAGFLNAGQRIGIIHQRLRLDKERVDGSYLAAELLNVYDAILETATRKRFLTVRMTRASLIDNPNLLGASVRRVFSRAEADIVESGNCLAAECHTAAVFHLMRVVEWGLRAFCVHLGVRKLRAVRKSGRVKFTPVDYSQWERILDDVQTKVDERIEKMRPGAKKQAAQEFYYPALQDIRGIRDAWRNHAMHTRRTYSPEDAEAIFGHVKRLMTTLASRFGPS